MSKCFGIGARVLVLLGVAAFSHAFAQGPPTKLPVPPVEVQPEQGPTIGMGLKFGLQPETLTILEAACARLASAKTLNFTAIAQYESPARTGLPLAYLTLSQVTLERPNKLKVVTPYDGPPSEFYYNGKTVMAYEPKADLVAVAKAPPTIDDMLKAADSVAAIYFPFTDLIVSDPCKSLLPSLKVAFTMGQSRVIGDTLTDIVVFANSIGQAQLWVGHEDHLPRMLRVVYFDEPGQYRHQVVLRDWQIDQPIPPGTFSSAAAAHAKRMQFARPDEPPPPPPGAKP